MKFLREKNPYFFFFPGARIFFSVKIGFHPSVGIFDCFRKCCAEEKKYAYPCLDLHYKCMSGESLLMKNLTKTKIEIFRKFPM